MGQRASHTQDFPLTKKGKSASTPRSAGSARGLTDIEQAEAFVALDAFYQQGLQRLLEAGQEFQDLAFEMEWRVGQCLGLLTQRDRLEDQIKRLCKPVVKFNIRARKTDNRRDNSDAVLRKLITRLTHVCETFEQASLEIEDRNQDGALLLDEIIKLEARTLRLAKGLSAMRPAMKQHMSSTRQKKDNMVMAASLEMLRTASTGDMPDTALLIATASLVEQKLARLSA